MSSSGTIAIIGGGPRGISVLERLAAQLAAETGDTGGGSADPVTVHLVDDGVDTGPIIAQREVPVLRGDTRASLHERIKTVERRLIVDVLHRSARHGYTIDGRKVWIND